MGDKLAPLPEGPYSLILADPPYTFKVWSEKGKDRSAEQHYDVLSVEEICALPVGEIAASDSVLLLWVTMPNLRDGLRVMDSWGFVYKTVAFTWAKVNEAGKPAIGLGYYTRANAELCLLGTSFKGLPRQHKDVSSLILAPRREHSRKPDQQYERIERLFGADTPRIELFARQRMPGWDAWGLGVDPNVPPIW